MQDDSADLWRDREIPKTPVIFLAILHRPQSGDLILVVRAAIKGSFAIYSWGYAAAYGGRKEEPHNSGLGMTDKTTLVGPKGGGNHSQHISEAQIDLMILKGCLAGFSHWFQLGFSPYRGMTL